MFESQQIDGDCEEEEVDEEEEASPLEDILNNLTEDYLSAIDVGSIILIMKMKIIPSKRILNHSKRLAAGVTEPGSEQVGDLERCFVCLCAIIVNLFQSFLILWNLSMIKFIIDELLIF